MKHEKQRIAVLVISTVRIGCISLRSRNLVHEPSLYRLHRPSLQSCVTINTLIAMGISLISTKKANVVLQCSQSAQDGLA